MMTAAAAIGRLDEAAGEEQGGLPEELFLFVSRVTPLVNVDLLIQDEAKGTLLTWRDDEYFGCGWHVPGGIIRHNEGAAQRIELCAQTEIGCGVTFGGEPLAVIETIEKRRDRGHFISLLYRCRLTGVADPEREAGETPQAGEWKWHRHCPDNLLAVQKRYTRYLDEGASGDEFAARPRRD